MGDGSLAGFLVILVLIGLQAILTLAHGALLNIRKGQMREAADDGDARAQMALNFSASSELSITYRLLVTLLMFACAGVAILNVAAPLLPVIDIHPFFIHAAILVGVALLSVILGDVVPEAVSTRYANPIAMVVVGPMRALVNLVRPFIWIIVGLSRLFSALFDSGKLVNLVTEEEIMTMVDAGHSDGVIVEEEKDMIYSVLEMDETVVTEIMSPRIDIVALAIDTTIQEAARSVMQSGYSRLPVYEEGLDNIRGLLYAKDLLAVMMRSGERPESVGALMRPVHFVPEEMTINVLLSDLLKRKIHLAVVQDEYGGTAGLVTIEDIMEEIVGDIQDEYDLNEEAEYIEHTPGEYTIDPGMDLDDFNELLDVDLPTDDSDTLAGYIYTYFGRVPEVGENLEAEGLVIHILEVDGRRLRKVKVARQSPSPTAPENADEVSS